MCLQRNGATTDCRPEKAALLSTPPSLSIILAGGSYPVGGAGAIAAAMVPQIEHNGGAWLPAPRLQASCSKARKPQACA